MALTGPPDDPGFSYRKETVYWSSGRPQTVWRKDKALGMPRLRDELLESAVYLYPSHASAAAGISAGASGFLIGTGAGVGEPVTAYGQPEVASIASSASHIYVVTNAHAIVYGNTSIRVNTPSGIEVIDTAIDDWVFNPDRDDLAIYYFRFIHHDAAEPLGFKVLPPTQLLSRELAQRLDVGIGDEVIIIGRFVSHERRQRNEPSLRFGHVSVMPNEPVPITWTRPVRRVIKQESFLVDGRAMGGYSGSPVLIWTPPYELTLPMQGQPTYRQRIWHATRQTTWLLGVCWGYIYDKWPILQKKGNAWEQFHRLYVEANTGMMGVVPCWKLIDLLNDARLRARREAEEGEYFGSANGKVE